MNSRTGRNLPLIALLLLGGMGAGGASAQTAGAEADQEAAIADTLLALTDSYNAAWEDLDLEQISQFHADDLRYYWRGATASSSQADFERLFREDILSQIRAYSAKVLDPHVEVLGSYAGAVSFVFDGVVETPEGVSLDYDGALTYVFERRDGEWKLVLIHESAPLREGQ